MVNQIEIELSRKRAVETAQAMLNGTLDYLVGAQILSTIRFDVGLDENDPDFQVFMVIGSETDSLPIGPSRQYWNKEALERLQPEYERSIQWAKSMSQDNCKSIVRRFGA